MPDFSCADVFCGDGSAVGIGGDITFSNCRFEIDPAGKEAYRNGGEVGFAFCQCFNGREHGRNVENLRIVP